MWRIKESIYEFKLEYWYLSECDDRCYPKPVAFIFAVKGALVCFFALCKSYKNRDIF